MLSSFIYANQSQKARSQMREGTVMSIVGTDGTYCNELKVRFAGGSMRIILEQTTPLPAGEAWQAATQADRIMGRLGYSAFRAGSLVSDYIEKHEVLQGSSSTEGATWQRVGSKLHLSARIIISADLAIPEFILAEVVDRVLADFRRVVIIEMDPSYKAYLAEKEARRATETFGGLTDGALAYLTSLLGREVSLGRDGMAGVMVGRPFGRFARHNGGFAG